MKKFAFLACILLAFASCKKEATTDNKEQLTTEDSLKNAEQALPKGYKVGDVAADFSLENIDNKKVSLADYKDAKGFIVIFTCNHCPYAKAYEDRILDLNKKYASQGYPVIAINPNDPAVQPEDSFQKMQERYKEKGFTFPYLFDEGQHVYPQYGATKTPHVFVLQKEEGKNIVRYIGAIDNNYENADDVSERYVEDAVNALIAGQEIKTTSTVAIGCTIKVKE